MLDNIQFINKESKKEIIIPLDKKMIFIYGKNGSGKTTLSRSINNDVGFVFNEDFIHKNVYVIENDGAKVDQNTKNNFSELLIGEEEIAIKKEIQEQSEFLKEIVQQKKEKGIIINKELIKNRLTESDNNLNSIIDTNFTYNYELSMEEQQKSYEYESQLIQTIKNDDELKLKINQLDKQENLIELNKMIENNLLLKSYLYSDESNIIKFNEEISNIKSNEKTIIKLETIAKEKNVSSEHFETIQKCLNIQKETQLDKCFLCGTNNMLKKIEEWNTIISDKTIEEKDKLKKKINSSIDQSKNIIKSEQLYNPVAPKTIKCIKKYIQLMLEIYESINDKKYKYLPLNPDELDSSIIETKTLKEEIRNYTFLPFEKDMIFLNSLENLISRNIKSKKDELDNLLSKNSKSNESSINGILIALGLNKEMSITVDKLGGKIKYKIGLKDGNINTLSDGQKHKLALAVFLNYIKDKDLKNKIVLFDDPVVSLDESGYHLFKNYVINNVMEKDINESPTLIILTHNFNYLYVQISNIISNEKFKENSIIYKLSEKNIQTLDFHYFELDDIALFKECLSQLKYKFQLIDLSSIYLKIFRVFLDLSLRIKGIPDTSNPAVEIEKLGLDSGEKKQLKDIHKDLCSISKNDNVDFTKSLERLEKLKIALDIIGFKYIYREDIEKAKTLLEKPAEYENDIFYILKEINLILKNTQDNKYVDYLNHPRNSFTQNILATSMNK